MTAQRQPFDPSEHFMQLKGRDYLPVAWRVVWFREEHDDGYIKTEMVTYDDEQGLAIFKAQAGFTLIIPHPAQDGCIIEREVYATGYGSETRRDFADFCEKAETKAVGRALALLGYGTAQASELDEGDKAVVDTPVDRPNGRGATRGLAVVPKPADIDELRVHVESGLAADPDAAARLPKTAADMDEAELSKTLTWLTRRARELGADGTSRGRTVAVHEPTNTSASDRPTPDNLADWTAVINSSGELLATVQKAKSGAHAGHVANARKILESMAKLAPDLVPDLGKPMDTQTTISTLEAVRSVFIDGLKAAATPKGAYA